MAVAAGSTRHKVQWVAPDLLNHTPARRKWMGAPRVITLGGCIRWLTARTISTREIRAARQAVRATTRCRGRVEAAGAARRVAAEPPEVRARAAISATPGSNPAAAPRVAPIVATRTTKGSAAPPRVAVRVTAT